jgi:hypothetical protein
MTTRKQIRSIREGCYLAEVDVELIDTGEGWAPYLSVQDAYKLDDVRAALRRGDVHLAASMASIFELTPIAA